jgi:anti-sigma factor RsiW
LSCDFVHTSLHAYLDGELDAAGSADFNQHLQTCSFCSAALGEQETLRRALEESRLYSRAPAGLKLRIQESLPGPSADRRIAGWWRWGAVLAAALIAATLSWRQFGSTDRQSYERTAMVAAVDAHLRSLQPGHLVDVQSTDQHTVKPWFDGKLDFAPPVRDLAANDFPLLGGRLDIIEGRTVAALVYGRRKHFISVFVEKSAPDASWNGSGQTQGYQWTAWKKNGFSFSAVSDVSAADLEELKQLLLQD